MWFCVFTFKCSSNHRWHELIPWRSIFNDSEGKLAVAGFLITCINVYAFNFCIWLHKIVMCVMIIEALAHLVVNFGSVNALSVSKWAIMLCHDTSKSLIKATNLLVNLLFAQNLCGPHRVYPIRRSRETHIGSCGHMLDRWEKKNVVHHGSVESVLVWVLSCLDAVFWSQ